MYTLRYAALYALCTHPRKLAETTEGPGYEALSINLSQRSKLACRSLYICRLRAVDMCCCGSCCGVPTVGFLDMLSV